MSVTALVESCTLQDGPTSSTSSESPNPPEETTTGTGEGESEGEGGTQDCEEYEEECVICLEKLSSQPWGRCTPCNHAFHKKCWWEWENTHNRRTDRKRARDPLYQDEGPKCCLCNTVNQQFLDGAGSKPAHNPSPHTVSEDPADAEEGGNRFTNWFREVSEEASGFVEFLTNEFSFNRARSTNTERRNFFGSGNNSRRSRSVHRASRTSLFSGANAPFGTTGISPFGMAPFFGNQPNSQQTWPSSFAGVSNTNPFNQMRPRTAVTTQHLDRRPELNGQRGTVLSYQPGSARYLVQFQSNVSNSITRDSTAAPVAIKPVNLLQTGVKIKIHGLRSQPQLNGKTGTVSAYSKERNRYIIQLTALLSPTREISLQPINIRIGNGMCVRLEGLQRTPQWNGKYGTIVGWVEDESGFSGSGRYEVRLSRQYAVRVKMEHVRL